MPDINEQSAVLRKSMGSRVKSFPFRLPNRFVDTLGRKEHAARAKTPVDDQSPVEAFIFADISRGNGNLWIDLSLLDNAPSNFSVDML